MKTIIAIALAWALVSTGAFAQESTMGTKGNGTFYNNTFSSSNIVGQFGAIDYNAQNTLNLNNRFQTYRPARIFGFSDDAIDSSSLFYYTIRSNLQSFMPISGSIMGLGGAYIMQPQGGTSVGFTFNDSLFPYYYKCPANASGTNTFSLTGTGFNANMLTVNYWASNGFGSLLIYTQSLSASVYGPTGAVLTINCNNSGNLTPMSSNIYLGSVTAVPITAGFKSIGTNIIYPFIGEYNTNTAAGFILDALGGGGAAWEVLLTNGPSSNAFAVFVGQNYDAVVMSDKGNPELGAQAAKSMVDVNGLPLDIIYVTQPPTTNDPTIFAATQSNFVWIASVTGSPVINCGAALSYTNTRILAPFYTSDGVHLNNAGATLLGNYFCHALNWNDDYFVGMGYQSIPSTTNFWPTAGIASFNGNLNFNTAAAGLLNFINVTAGASGEINLLAGAGGNNNHMIGVEAGGGWWGSDGHIAFMRRASGPLNVPIAEFDVTATGGYLDMYNAGAYQHVIATNGAILLKTNYNAAAFTPVPGYVSIVASNRVVYIVDDIKTNVLVNGN